MRSLLLASLALPALALAQPTLSLDAIGKTYIRDTVGTPAGLFFSSFDASGSTSVRNETAAGLEWKTDGYYQRNRDLGQIFTMPAGGEARKLDALVVRTGNSSTAVLSGAAGTQVYMQIFEVVGTPVINDNGTPVGTNSTHGYTTNHRADDYLEGVTYHSLAIFEGAAFPNLPATTQAGGQEGHLHYLRWSVTDAASAFVLEPGKRYAVMFGFAEENFRAGFTLANSNIAGDAAAPALRPDGNGQATWAIRREGDGTLPPTEVPGASPPADSVTRTALQEESLFAPDWRTSLAPTTDGYPDVDTYRSYEFYVETSAAPIPEPASIGVMAGLTALGFAAKRRR